jgi:hypothetical protein
MLKKSHILFISIFLYTKISVAHIITTSNYDTIENNIKTADTNTLIIFDVDEVLFQPQDQILNIKNIKELENILDNIKNRLNQQQIQELDSIMMLQRKVAPIDPKFINLIKTLQNKQIKTLALTQCSTGPLGKISSLEDWRIKELKKIGYNFDKSWDKINTKFFETLKSTVELKRVPAFKQGIIFSCGVTKSTTLKAFLNYVKLNPKKIIFIDDKRKNVNSIEQFAKKNKIEFLGFEYTKVANTTLDPLNITMAKLQFDTLEKKHKWLSDKDAIKILK